MVFDLCHDKYLEHNYFRHIRWPFDISYICPVFTCMFWRWHNAWWFWSSQACFYGGVTWPETSAWLYCHRQHIEYSDHLSRWHIWNQNRHISWKQQSFLCFMDLYWFLLGKRHYCTLYASYCNAQKEAWFNWKETTFIVYSVLTVLKFLFGFATIGKPTDLVKPQIVLRLSIRVKDIPVV